MHFYTDWVVSGYEFLLFARFPSKKKKQENKKNLLLLRRTFFFTKNNIFFRQNAHDLL